MPITFDRRRFVRALASAAAAPSALRAQPANRIFRIGFLEAGSPSANRHFLDAFLKGMQEMGYVEGRNAAITARWAEGKAERFEPLLSEFVALQQDVIVVASTLGAVAARRVVRSTPVVFVGVADPLDAGLVASLARPGGNLTGLSRAFDAGLIGKTLQLL